MLPLLIKENSHDILYCHWSVYSSFYIAVPTKVVKRKSLSAGGQKRRSLLPTPLRSGRITRSQSRKSKSSSTDYSAQGALPFNISPSAELAKPKTATASGSQADLSLEPSKSSFRLSDPFSPGSQAVTVDPVQDCMGGDSVVRNLIELSPTLPTEVSDRHCDISYAPVKFSAREQGADVECLTYPKNFDKQNYLIWDSHWLINSQMIKCGHHSMEK